MAGQFQHPGDGHLVTGGSADDELRGAEMFISQQDERYKMTTVFDDKQRVVKEVEYEKNAKGKYKETETTFFPR